MFNDHNTTGEQIALGAVYLLQAFAALLIVGLMLEACYWGTT